MIGAREEGKRWCVWDPGTRDTKGHLRSSPGGQGCWDRMPTPPNPHIGFAFLVRPTFPTQSPSSLLSIPPLSPEARCSCTKFSQSIPSGGHRRAPFQTPSRQTFGIGRVVSLSSRQAGPPKEPLLREVPGGGEWQGGIQGLQSSWKREVSAAGAAEPRSRFQGSSGGKKEMESGAPLTTGGRQGCGGIRSPAEEPPDAGRHFVLAARGEGMWAQLHCGG